MYLKKRTLGLIWKSAQWSSFMRSETWALILNIKPSTSWNLRQQLQVAAGEITIDADKGSEMLGELREDIN